MMEELGTPHIRSNRSLRLNTLIRLRWLAIVGQSAAVLVVFFGLGFPLPVGPCFALIAASAWLNLYLTFRYPSVHLLQPRTALVLLMLDASQLAGLLYLTGGITNPFAVLMIVPVVISATTLPLRLTVILGAFVIVVAALVSAFHLPLPWRPGVELIVPTVHVFGMLIAIVSTTVFTAVYAYRVAEEAHMLADALSATELVLQREQHISALDGLAAAAAHELGTPLATITLVAREMEKTLGEDPRFREDVTLLRSQSERCREILKRLTSLSSEGELHIGRLPLTSLIEEIAAPHRNFGITIDMQPETTDGPEPVGRRNPGVLYGLGNLVENAVDFARDTVEIRWSWDQTAVRLTILDDGPGFPMEVIDRIGEPYVSRRKAGASSGGGLGLGLFIAKTLLERSGATLDFANAGVAGKGAKVTIRWPRERFLTTDGAQV
ncbi:ATPase [Nitratireductor aestuarii]|uniref:histidine kinase n=1 Tax=Nitratireductor aestuarii TaxID=1735103 RepID=A0A916RKY5_9HYPH|nr:ActS/PrrB/RegB family redox-sensitive histidine kinase [Nitratireductor aestuarii]GGA57707.1 ATPase [Nitratireductor aestuarii]